jgi:hypothetical protein
MAFEIDELKRRGFSPDDLFGMSPERARAILADPESNKLTEKYGKGAQAPTDTLCRFCKQGGDVRYFSPPEDAFTPSRPRMTLRYPLYLEHCPQFFDSGKDLEDSPDDAPSNTGNEGTSASVPGFLTTPVKDELRKFGCTEEYIHDVPPAEAHAFLAQRRKLTAVLTAWSATIGCAQPCTAERVEAAAADGGGKLKAAVRAATDGMPLEDWLRENSSIEVNQLTLREAGTDKDGRPQWTLELRVEPDRGSDAD